jgi:small subunit ribosomal protein S5
MKKDNANLAEESEFFEKVIKINRVNKVVKGGKRLAFRVFVICGNKNGSVGFGVAKAKEVPIAIRKAIEKAKRNMFSINTVNDTIPHEVVGSFGASRVVIKPARAGKGVIAGGAMKSILELLGVKNVVGKSLGSRNPINVAKAAVDALLTCKNKAEEELNRGILISSYHHRLEMGG